MARTKRQVRKALQRKSPPLHVLCVPIALKFSRLNLVNPADLVNPVKTIRTFSALSA